MILDALLEPQISTPIGKFAKKATPFMESKILEKEKKMAVEELVNIVMIELSYTNGCLIIVTIAFAIVSMYLYLKVKKQEETINKIYRKLKRCQIINDDSRN